MSLSRSPRLIKAGLVMIDPQSAQVRRVIALQYNPEKLTRSLQVQGAGEGAERSEALRLKGPAVETFQLEAEIDAADQLQFPEQHQAVVDVGIAPQLAVLESLINPAAADLLAGKALAAAGTPAIQAPSSARASTSSEKSAAQAEARAQRAAPSRPKRISRSRPQRSATRLNGISNSAIVPVPAVTLRLTVPAEIPKASLSCGSSGCVP